MPKGRIRGFLLLTGILVLILVLASACTGEQGIAGPAGPTGPKGDTGSQGPAGPAPSAEQIQAAVTAVVSGPPASAENIAKGGRLYDEWWAEAGANPPAGDQPLWALQSTNTRTGSISFRCKECHGWDYKGVGGAYGSGSHKTGFTGVYAASQTQSKEQLVDILKGGTDFRHDFSGLMTGAQLSALADFLAEGIINDTVYIDYATKAPRGTVDAAKGQQRYSTTCAACHGSDGKQINFGSPSAPEYVGTIAAGNPWEFVHKARFGQPGTAMPVALTLGWSLQDVMDILAYSRTLPAK